MVRQRCVSSVDQTKIVSVFGEVRVQVRNRQSAVAVLLKLPGGRHQFATVLTGRAFHVARCLAGMFFHPKVVDADIYSRVEQQMSGITRGFLAPVFFVSVGLHLDFSAVGQVPGFVVVLTLIALVSKLVGSGLPAYWTGLSAHESLVVGVGMSGRGAVELIIAGVALEAGLFLQPSPPGVIVESLFSSVVIMAIVTTVVAPIVLRKLSA